MIIGYLRFNRRPNPRCSTKRATGSGAERVYSEKLAAQSRIGRLWPRQSWPLAPAMSCWSAALIGYRGQRALR
jgi:hypothetical protein